MSISKNMNIQVTFETSGTNVDCEYPSWRAQAYVFGNMIADVWYEAKDSTEAKILKMCEEEARAFIADHKE